MAALNHFAATFLNWYREEKPFHMYGASYPDEGEVAIVHLVSGKEIMRIYDYAYNGGDHNSLAEIELCEREGYDRQIVLYGAEGYYITDYYYNSLEPLYKFSAKEKDEVMRWFRKY
ncbi:hypothetical protein BNJ_00148 [Kaumoebavirus]|uniref:hypothetical protein n=1 Tax=Kaumoebavirus TaxID=1859492 RepID=UPI0009C2953F|nr:hypothetical protein BNJ_00148 [Kaumoebavirus]ARA71980.1 hypothetical protein BNJ_00148 [Kaumoebavirus]